MSCGRYAYVGFAVFAGVHTAKGVVAGICLSLEVQVGLCGYLLFGVSRVGLASTLGWHGRKRDGPSPQPTCEPNVIERYQISIQIQNPGQFLQCHITRIHSPWQALTSVTSSTLHSHYNA